MRSMIIHLDHIEFGCSDPGHKMGCSDGCALSQWCHSGDLVFENIDLEVSYLPGATIHENELSEDGGFWVVRASSSGHPLTPEVVETIVSNPKATHVVREEIIFRRETFDTMYHNGTKEVNIVSTKITSLEQMKRICSRGDIVEFYILFMGCLKSSKDIQLINGRWHVLHLIDSSEEVLSDKELMESNIGRAIKDGRFFQYDTLTYERR